MEILLQWSDDLDDLICAAAFVLVRTRRSSLQLGLLAALLLPLATLSEPQALVAAATALACVAVWVLALIAHTLGIDRGGAHAAA